MRIRFMIPLALLALGLAACDSGEQAGSAETAQPAEADAAGTASSSGSSEAAGEPAASSGDTSEPAPPDPEEVLSATAEQSEAIWSLIQENHSKLTDQQQRSLQACAELAVEEEGLTAEQSVAQCRQELEQKAKEQQQEESQSGETEGDGEEGGN